MIQNWGMANIDVNLIGKFLHLIFVAVTSLTRRGSKRNTENGNAVTPCISSVDFELILYDCLEVERFKVNESFRTFSV